METQDFSWGCLFPKASKIPRLILATPPHTEANGYLGISSKDASFPMPNSLVSWLADQLLVGKLAPVYTGQGAMEKETTTPDCYMAGLTSKETYTWGLFWVTVRWIDLCTHLPNLENLYTGLNWVQSLISSRCSQQYIIISRLYLWGSFWKWVRQVECIF